MRPRPVPAKASQPAAPVNFNILARFYDCHTPATMGRTRYPHQTPSTEELKDRNGIFDFHSRATIACAKFSEDSNHHPFEDIIVTGPL